MPYVISPDNGMFITSSLIVKVPDVFAGTLMTISAACPILISFDSIVNVKSALAMLKVLELVRLK